MRGSDDALAARAERFKGTSAAEDAAAEAAAAAAARPFAPFAGAGRSKLRVVNKLDTMRRFYVRLLKSGSVRQKLLVPGCHQATALCFTLSFVFISRTKKNKRLIVEHRVDAYGLILILAGANRSPNSCCD